MSDFLCKICWKLRGRSWRAFSPAGVIGAFGPAGIDGADGLGAEATVFIVNGGSGDDDGAEAAGLVIFEEEGRVILGVGCITGVRADEVEATGLVVLRGEVGLVVMAFVGEG